MCFWSPCFLFIAYLFSLDAVGRTNSLITSICSNDFRRGWWCFIIIDNIIPEQNVYIFWWGIIFKNISYGLPNNFFFYIAFLIPQAFLLITLISFSLELQIFWQLPSRLWDFSYILKDFWMLPMLVTVLSLHYERHW